MEKEDFFNYKNVSSPNFQIPELHAVCTYFPSNLVPLPSKSMDQLPRKLSHELIFRKWPNSA